MDSLFGKPKAVKLGPPGQEAAGRSGETPLDADEKKREWEFPNVQYDPDDLSDVTPNQPSWDKIK